MATPSPDTLRSEISFSVPVQIRFSDIDGYGHVNNGIYFNYFEHSRASFLYHLLDWDIQKVGTVVARVTLDYFRPIHIDDQVESLVHCTRLGNSSFDMEQYLIGTTAGGESVTFAKCQVVLVSVDMKTMRPLPIPAKFREKLAVNKD